MRKSHVGKEDPSIVVELIKARRPEKKKKVEFIFHHMLVNFDNLIIKSNHLNIRNVHV